MSELSPKQEKALTALLAGATPTQAAKTTGVSRSTIYKWLVLPHFEAEFNARRRELSEAARERLAQLELKAIVAVEAAIEAGDAKVALSVLRGIGALPGERRSIGSASAQEIAAQQTAKRAFDELLDSVEASMFGTSQGDLGSG